MIRSARALVLAATVVASCTALPTAASAAPMATIRGAHLSPDTGAVDVYLTAFAGGTTSLWLSSVGYGDVSPYQRFPAGLYAVSMRPHGAASSTPAALSWTFTAKAGQPYTAAAVGMNADLHGIVLQDETTPPPAGQGRVRVIQAASRAPHAEVAVQGGAVLTKSVAFSDTTGYTSVKSGSLHVDAKSDTNPSVRTSATVSIRSGGVNSVVLLDGKGSSGIAIRTLIDAAGAATAPVGPVPAGGGGTAARPHADPTWAWFAAGLFGLVLIVAVGRRRATR